MSLKRRAGAIGLGNRMTAAVVFRALDIQTKVRSTLGLRAHTKPSLTVITIIYSQVTRRDDVRNGVDFIGSHFCDAFYFENDTQKLVVVDNICTGPFENIAHIRDARFHRATCFSMRQPQLSGLLERIVEIGRGVMMCNEHLCSIQSGATIRHRARHRQKHLKVGTFNN